MKNIREINVMLGGDKPSELPANKNWCGVDGGALYLVDNSIFPILSCGDFDSVSLEDKELIKKSSKFFMEKDSQNLTDGEFSLLKIKELFKNIEKINIYGATGKRLDHFFANVLLLNNDNFNNIDINIIDDNNFITVAKPLENTFYKKKEYKYFSIVPFVEETYITIIGAKYEASDLKLLLNRPSATSNEFLRDKIKITTNKKCLIIYSKD